MGRTASITAIALSLLVSATAARSEPTTATTAEVLANPTRYYDTPVRVHGFATFEFENHRVWRDEAAFRNGERTQAVLIDPTGVPETARSEAKGRRAYVTGTVRRFGAAQTILEDVTSVQRDPTDTGPERGWADADFLALLIVLSILGFLVLGFAFSATRRDLFLPNWKPRRPSR